MVADMLEPSSGAGAVPSETHSTTTTAGRPFSNTPGATVNGRSESVRMRSACERRMVGPRGRPHAVAPFADSRTRLRLPSRLTMVWLPRDRAQGRRRHKVPQQDSGGDAPAADVPRRHDKNVEVNIISPALVAAAVNFGHRPASHVPHELLQPDDVASAVRFVVIYPSADAQPDPTPTTTLRVNHGSYSTSKTSGS